MVIIRPLHTELDLIDQAGLLNERFGEPNTARVADTDKPCFHSASGDHKVIT